MIGKLSLLERVKLWLDHHKPVWCTECGKLIFKKDAMWERLTTGKHVTLCVVCWRTLFRPFSKR